jgi:hypothetical protein
MYPSLGCPCRGLTTHRLQVGDDAEQDLLLKKAIHVLSQIQETSTVRSISRGFHRDVSTIHIRNVSVIECARTHTRRVESQDKLLQKEMAGLMSTLHASASAELALSEDDLLAVAAEAQFCLSDQQLVGYALFFHRRVRCSFLRLGLPPPKPHRSTRH